MPRFPPSPDEVLRKLFRVLQPPRPPKFFPREEEEGLPRKRRVVAGIGSKMIWPYRITWKESPAGRGQIKVLKEVCPECGGQVIANYKHRWWLGKCVGCSRVWNIKGEEEQICLKS